MFAEFVGFLNEECYWFSLVGKIYGLYVSYRVLSQLWKWMKLYFLSPVLHLAANVKSYGKWAVVTGATDGIGKSYAELLAKRGMSVVLVSRSAEKLKKVASEIGKNYSNVETKCVVADFSHDTFIYEKIEKEIKDLDIGVLVNNVGMLQAVPEYFSAISYEELKNVLTVNCFSVAFMTKMIIPKMVNKKKGIIINISSLSAHFPIPFIALYAGTKAFMRHFSECLMHEYKSKGIVVQCVSPGLVATNMTKLTKHTFFAPMPDSFVSAALDTVGLDPWVSGCFAHDFQKTILDLSGEFIVNKFTYNLSKGVRDRSIAEKSKDM